MNCLPVSRWMKNLMGSLFWTNKRDGAELATPPGGSGSLPACSGNHEDQGHNILSRPVSYYALLRLVITIVCRGGVTHCVVVRFRVGLDLLSSQDWASAASELMEESAEGNLGENHPVIRITEA